VAIPSGSGSEVLKIAHVAGVTNSENVLINGVANHIYTILNITVCETAAATGETFDLYIDDDGGGTDYEILSDQAIGANETFVWNDKLVLSGTDHLCMITASSANIDVTISYIDQDWT
tara:strand:+ start:291 stop:644 length:354 start_codon:yes stop_codon:yes gene_type:complete